MNLFCNEGVFPTTEWINRIISSLEKVSHSLIWIGPGIQSANNSEWIFLPSLGWALKRGGRECLPAIKSLFWSYLILSLMIKNQSRKVSSSTKWESSYCYFDAITPHTHYHPSVFLALLTLLLSPFFQNQSFKKVKSGGKTTRWRRPLAWWIILQCPRKPCRYFIMICCKTRFLRKDVFIFKMYVDVWHQISLKNLIQIYNVISVALFFYLM